MPGRSIDVIIPHRPMGYDIDLMAKNCIKSYLQLEKSNKLNIAVIDTSQMSNHGSIANGMGIDEGIKKTKSPYVFICHNDTMLCSVNGLDYLADKLDHGYGLAGFFMDNSKERDSFLHIAGLMFKRDLYANTSAIPETLDETNDVGQPYTQRCKELNMDIFVTRNTRNNPEIRQSLDARNNTKDLPGEFAIDNNDNLMWFHIGRGSTKPSRAQVFNQSYKRLVHDKILFRSS